jgi:hypothetical protein
MTPAVSLSLRAHHSHARSSPDRVRQEQPNGNTHPVRNPCPAQLRYSRLPSADLVGPHVWSLPTPGYTSYCLPAYRLHQHLVIVCAVGSLRFTVTRG